MDRIINYARGTHIHSATVRNVSAPNFKSFANIIANDRAKTKGLQYICAPMAGKKRNGEAVQNCAFLALDCDGATPEAFKQFLQFLSGYQSFYYTTFSHTAEKPRARAIIALNRAVTPKERLQVGNAFHAGLELICDVELDKSVYRAEQPLFTPPVGAESGYFDGEPLKVEDYLFTLPEQPTTPPTHEKPQSLTERQNDKEFDRLTLLNQVSPQTFIDLQSAVKMLPADDYGDWLAVGMALAFFKETEYESRALALFHAYSEKSAKYDSDTVNEKWESLTTPDNTSYKAIFTKAQGRGWLNPMAKMLSTVEEDPQKMKINQLSEMFLTGLGGKDNLRAAVDNSVMRYNGKYWERIADEVIIRQVRALLDNLSVSYNDNKVRSVLNTMKIQLDLLNEENSDFIAFNNGVVNRNTGAFGPHEKNHFLTACSPHDYLESQTETPVFTEWVNFVAGGDLNKSAVIRAALYMVLTNRWNWQLFIELVGVGGSGKSVFTELAAVLVGRKNVVSKRLEELDLARDRDSLETARLITIPDQQRYQGQGAGLKGITGGDLLRIDPKHKTPYSAYIRAVVLMSHNGTVNFTERNNGIERRRVLIHFNQEVPPDKKDYSFSQKLEMECGGIISQLLAEFSDPFTARRILENQRNSKEALALKQESDHTIAFAAHFETMETCNGLRVGTKRNAEDMRFFYAMYLRYCEAYGHSFPVSVVKFKEAMQTAFRAQGEKFSYRTDKSRNGFFTNVRLRRDSSLDTDWLQEQDFSI